MFLTKKSKDVFHCLVCINQLSSGQELKCGHTFCEDCLHSYEALYWSKSEKGKEIRREELEGQEEVGGGGRKEKGDEEMGITTITKTPLNTNQLSPTISLADHCRSTQPSPLSCLLIHCPTCRIVTPLQPLETLAPSPKTNIAQKTRDTPQRPRELSGDDISEEQQPCDVCCNSNNSSNSNSHKNCNTSSGSQDICSTSVRSSSSSSNGSSSGVGTVSKPSVDGSTWAVGGSEAVIRDVEGWGISRQSVGGTTRGGDVVEEKVREGRNGEVAAFYCVKCFVNMCKNCRDCHDKLELMRGHSVIPIKNKEKAELHCHEHPKMTSTYFCVDCRRTICTVCILRDHAKHRTTKLRDAISNRREHLKTLLNSLGARLDYIEAQQRILCDLRKPRTNEYAVGFDTIHKQIHSQASIAGKFQEKVHVWSRKAASVHAKKHDHSEHSFIHPNANTAHTKATEPAEFRSKGLLTRSLTWTPRHHAKGKRSDGIGGVLKNEEMPVKERTKESGSGKLFTDGDSGLMGSNSDEKNSHVKFIKVNSESPSRKTRGCNFGDKEAISNVGSRGVGQKYSVTTTESQNCCEAGLSNKTKEKVSNKKCFPHAITMVNERQIVGVDGGGAVDAVIRSDAGISVTGKRARFAALRTSTRSVSGLYELTAVAREKEPLFRKNTNNFWTSTESGASFEDEEKNEATVEEFGKKQSDLLECEEEGVPTGISRNIDGDESLSNDESMPHDMKGIMRSRSSRNIVRFYTGDQDEPLATIACETGQTPDLISQSEAPPAANQLTACRSKATTLAKFYSGSNLDCQSLSACTRLPAKPIHTAEGICESQEDKVREASTTNPLLDRSCKSFVDNTYSEAVEQSQFLHRSCESEGDSALRAVETKPQQLKAVENCASNGGCINLVIQDMWSGLPISSISIRSPPDGCSLPSSQTAPQTLAGGAAVDSRSKGDDHTPLSSSSSKPIYGKAGNMEEMLTVHSSRLRSLFNLATKTLDMSSSKKLLSIYEDLVDRLQTVLEFDIPQLTAYLEQSISAQKFSVRRITDYNSHSEDRADAGQEAAVDGCGLISDGMRLNESSRRIATRMHKSPLIRPKLLWKVDRQRNDIGELWNPCDVAFLPDESAVVAEYDNMVDRNNRLQIFDQNGKSVEIIAQGQVWPLGVAVTLNGQLVVTDCKAKRVKLLTLKGQNILDIGKGQFGWPYGVAVNSRGQIIVTDAFNDTISIYTIDGRRVKMFGSSGSKSTQFKNPYHVTVDSHDDIIVSDSGNNCVKVFDISGRLLFVSSEAENRRPSLSDTILSRRRLVVDSAIVSVTGGSYGIRGRHRTTLRGPCGVTVDPVGNILVADDCSRVAMFDQCGTYVRNLLGEEDLVRYPDSIRCSPAGRLAVTEWNANNACTIKMFHLYE